MQAGQSKRQVILYDEVFDTIVDIHTDTAPDLMCVVTAQPTVAVHAILSSVVVFVATKNGRAGTGGARSGSSGAAQIQQEDSDIESTILVRKYACT